MSKNTFSADNQQERLRTQGWLVGFTDGEGAFTVSILKNPTSKIGWQVFPEFIVTQGEKSLALLMNRKKTSRFLESSHTTRQTSNEL